MKILWLCNNSPLNNNKKGGGGWFSRMATELDNTDILLISVFPGKENSGKRINDDDKIYYTFKQSEWDRMYRLYPQIEKYFCDILYENKPDVIHIWGTEFAHALSMVLAAERLDMLDRIVVHIQGFCFSCADVIEIGLPFNVIFGYNPRDVILGNIRSLKKQFSKRGNNEYEIIKRVKNIIGRTSWDYANIKLINSEARYFFCGELLRDIFYSGQWSYEKCEKNSIFISQASYPIKGLHIFLKAIAEVSKTNPQVKVYIAGGDVTKQSHNIKDRFALSKYGSYIKRLIKQYNLQKNIIFVGPLGAEGMRDYYLRANVYVLPSFVENSPNSLAEAMLLGTPCIASYAGGIPDYIKNNETGFLYPSYDYRLLASQINYVLNNNDIVKIMSIRVRNNARKIFNTNNTLHCLLKCYEEISGDQSEIRIYKNE